MLTAYEETLDFLYSNLPMFQRVGAAALKPDLTNTLKLCALLGNPQHKFKSIHVAGTNGKGSTSHMLASIFQSAGYKTGLYTSPHLKTFTERIRVNGEEIDRDFIVDFVNRMKPAIADMQPSFFEITVAMAFEYFVSRQVDIAIVEVGLGGRLDATNVIVPELSVITNIGWDHKDLLGDTLEKIAGEKAGIIKTNVPVIVSERQPGIDTVFQERADQLHTTIQFASDEFEVNQHNVKGCVALSITKGNQTIYSDLVLPLQGYYQRKNIAGVLKAVELMRDLGWKIDDKQLDDGLQRVTTQTGLKGRWQILETKPFTVCDTGHNVDGIREVVAQIKAQPYRRLFMIVGMVKDKDIRDVLRLLPNDARYYFCQAKIPRALDAQALAALANEAGLSGIVMPDVNDALEAARKEASEDDMIFVGGSTFVVAEIKDL
ncbi:bifunctional folylpolyglutamate synthase/dihydrofolate synthase [Chryseolinea lacunae]|uniref:Dihydrofolate synthase/folylpolyglutamate synthase n=1 Tax=Chryseolinea lacunae TaxID=2801331 RepID=A0ABS1KY01_9BACT|nr:folylpolyglutamate synthase/dihydrofolate synthase family protein [Chryseolinea lacunae]MBL0744333.1 bifunctional folylpolyglutamate synthase/dihydrofolate synthase [Chryseolinea lacunae]